MTMANASAPHLLIRAVPDEDLRRWREHGRDDYGHPLVVRSGDAGNPLRCCLRDSTDEDAIVLVSYAPVRRSMEWSSATGATGSTGSAGVTSSTCSSPYDEVGPIFVHATECPGPEDDATYPAVWVNRQQVLRAYDAAGSISGGLLLRPGDGRDEAARQLLADPSVAFVHSRNVVYGCYMLEIRRRNAWSEPAHGPVGLKRSGAHLPATSSCRRTGSGPGGRSWPAP